MPITRNPENLYTLTDYTTEINSLDRQYSLTPVGMFTSYETTQHSILFDKDSRTTTLLPSVARGPRHSTYGEDEVFETFALRLAYFKHSDYITPEDIQSVRMMGTPDGVKRLDVARATKIEQLRRSYDQSMEYMRFRLITQGKCVTPSAELIADLFTEFGETQTEITLDLTSTEFDLSLAIRQIKRAVRDGLNNGGIMVEPTIYLASEDFDALVTHANVKDAYKYFSATVNPQRDDIIEGFRHAGVNIIPLDGAFNLPTGVSEDIMTVGEGYAVPLSANIYRQYAGPSNKLNGANGGVISDLYAYEYPDPKDENYEMQIEASVLMLVEQPKALVKLNIVK